MIPFLFIIFLAHHCKAEGRDQTNRECNWYNDQNINFCIPEPDIYFKKLECPWLCPCVLPQNFAMTDLGYPFLGWKSTKNWQCLKAMLLYIRHSDCQPLIGPQMLQETYCLQKTLCLFLRSVTGDYCLFLWSLYPDSFSLISYFRAEESVNEIFT